MILPETNRREKESRALSIDYLRSFLIILVVLHHSALAYIYFRYDMNSALINAAVPIMDHHKSRLLDLFIALNDTFFMSLFFLISGIFFVPSFKRKGAKAYLLERSKRLGIPFLTVTFTIIPLAYWASHLTVAAKPLASFWMFYLKFFSSGKWSPGPSWFLWVLLLYSIVTVSVYAHFPTLVAKCARKPLAPFLTLLAGVLFLPFFVFTGPYHWSAFLGPLVVQTSRIGLYFSFFFVGTLVGFTGKDTAKVFSQNYSKLILIGIIAYAFYLITTTHTISANIQVQRVVMGVAFLTVCICFNLGLPRLFLNRGHNRNFILDNLSANSYGIFLLHYPIVTWIQYSLLQISLPALIKFIIVGASSLLFSWGASELIRKSPAVRRLI